MTKRLLFFIVIFLLISAGSVFVLKPALAKAHSITVPADPLPMGISVRFEAYKVKHQGEFMFKVDIFTDDNITLTPLQAEHVKYFILGKREYCSDYKRDKYIECMVEELNDNEIFLDK